jgi:uncharacterized protein (DUF2461 family)
MGITRSIEVQGTWFGQACQIIAEHDVKEVLDYFYYPEQIEQYLNDARIELTNKALEWFSSSKNLVWRETREPVTLDKYFFEVELEYVGDTRSFKADLRKSKFSIKQLSEFNRRLYNPDTFLDKHD